MLASAGKRICLDRSTQVKIKIQKYITHDKINMCDKLATWHYSTCYGGQEHALRALRTNMNNVQSDTAYNKTHSSMHAVQSSHICSPRGAVGSSRRRYKQCHIISHHITSHHIIVYHIIWHIITPHPHLGGQEDLLRAVHINIIIIIQ